MCDLQLVWCGVDVLVFLFWPVLRLSFFLESGNFLSRENVYLIYIYIVCLSCVVSRLSSLALVSCLHVLCAKIEPMTMFGNIPALNIQQHATASTHHSNITHHTTPHCGVVWCGVMCDMM